MPLKLKESLEKSSLSERAYDILKQQIISGNLAPGEKLDIHELARQLKISRTPVKVAINRLANQGLVTIRSRKATCVSTIDAKKIREAFEVRLMIELWGAKRACQEPGSLDLERMKAMLDKCVALFSADQDFDYHTFNHLDMAFHRNIVGAAQNTLLLESYDSLSVHIQAMRVYWGQARRPALDSHNEHLAILKALQEGSLENARRALATHLTRSRDDVIRVLEERHNYPSGKRAR